MFLAYVMFIIEYRICERDCMSLREMHENMIAAYAIASIGRIWTGVGQVQYSHMASMPEVITGCTLAGLG